MSRLRELFDRHRAGEELEGEELAAVTAEYERLIGLSEAAKRNLALGRAIGAKANRERKEGHSKLWLSEARRILQEKPYRWGDLDGVASDVREFCRVRRATFRNGRLPSLMSIRRFLREHTNELRA